MPVNQLQYTCAETVRRVYALARSLSRILGVAGLRYWTSGGTTLGILRYGIYHNFLTGFPAPGLQKGTLA